MHQAAVGQLAQARQAFVPRVVDVEVQTFQVLATLAAPVDAGEEYLDVGAEAFANRQVIAGHAAGVVDQG